jgi:hypothetical protein
VTWHALLTLVLAIPDRPQAPESPPSGWCGETAIQEGLLHLGMWASQKKIHDAGKSKHPDLYSNELPTALANLGVVTSTFAGKDYAQFVEDALNDGDPVIAGVKILPTEHPKWGLDHFVLVVGYGPKGFLVNTTWNKQQWASAQSTNGISFANAFYAIRMKSIAGLKHPARLRVLSEDDKTVKLAIDCTTTRVVTIDAQSVARFSCD